MPMYFAYGANLDTVAMAQRCPRSRLLGPARLARHRFAMMREGYATVVHDPAAMVHGLLYDLALSDVPALDRFEEVGGGLYVKLTQPVLRANGGAVRALVYSGRSGATRGARPKPGSMEAIVAAAGTAGLPAEHVTYLRSLLPGPAGEAAKLPGAQRRAIKYIGPIF